LKTGRGKNGQEMPRETREYVGRVLGTEATQAKMYLDPAKRMALESRLETEQKEAEKRAVNFAVDSAYADLSGKIAAAPSIDDQDILAGELIGKIGDPKVAKGVKALYDAQRSVKELQQKAQDTKLGMEFRQQAAKDGITPAQAEYMDKPNGFSDAGWEKAKKSLHKDAQRPTSESWENYHSLLRDIDLGNIKDNTDIDAFAFDKTLTDTQIEKARKYLSEGGNLGNLKFSTVERIYKSMTKSKSMPEEFYDLVQQNIEPGKPVTEDSLRKVIANLGMDGVSKSDAWYHPLGWRSETYQSAQEAGRGKEFLPDVPSEDYARIKSILEEKGITVTHERVRKYYGEEIGLYNGRAQQ
jgi:hypothetical protein